VTTGPGGGPGGPAAAEPVCPRHPDRVAYVRCQRCERPVCPQCQRPAAVGVQCVDCVRAQAKGQRTARTAFGGRVTDTRPVVTIGIIGLCVLAFLAQRAVPDFTDRFDFYPPEALAEPYRFLTSAFLHSPSFLLHIVFNMYALWIVGPQLEYLFGRVRFAALYLAAAVGGSVGYLVLVPASAAADSAWVNGAVGASGAIFGLFGAFFVVTRRLGRDSTGILGVIVINGALGFIPGLNIAWQAHLGGLLTGAAVAAVLVLTPKERRAVLQPAGLVAVVVLLAVLVAVKVAVVPGYLFA
jgi:membrane associated rhomboid family serine protease